ncbi:hypothetical protein HQ865_10660 [Mucilaginibacter mali]|uniref:Uncharacterized protein n=1 Tax=Mucilaginibacter mali TaxID=2740462 RepID=A0A7D4QAV1_9SPHI|nr:hypothetical protein [Mucilaginibacter mali]QKJ30204.1 hypothetical protein HQ865_10660 [Mucilaginibacter mali]
MSAENTISIPNLLSRQGKIYCFADDCLIVSTDAYPDAKMVIPREKVLSLRFGVKWIKGLYFPIGRHFNIELKLDNNEIIPLKFSSYYGIKKDLYTDKFGELINAVWANLFQPDLLDIAERFKKREALFISGVEFNHQGVCWNDNELIPWDKVQLSNYKTYFAIRHADNALFNKSLRFSTDWDSYMLQQVIKNILEQRAKHADQKYSVNLN